MTQTASSPITLRPYQREAVTACVESMQEHVSTLLVLPTGCGKTIVFCDIIQRLQQRGRAMVIAHRDELIQQAAQKILHVTGDLPDIEKADQWADQHWQQWRAKAIVSSVQTQNSGRNGNLRMKRFDPYGFGLLVVDEAHHAIADTYRRLIDYYRRNENLYLLGVTATPDRHDDSALGEIFQDCAYEYYIADAVRDGWLVNIQQRYVHVEGLDFSGCRTTAGDLNGKDLERQVLYEKPLLGMADPIFELSAGRKTLVFAVSVAHAERLAEILNRYEPGCAGFVCGSTPLEDRRQLFRDYRDGSFRFLVNVGVTTEGYDEPGVEVIVMARPTKSRSLYEQMLGRGTRPLPGIVDGIDDDESQRHLPYDGEEEQARIRRQRITDSAKPFMEVIDFVGNSGRHKLVSSCDVLGGKYDDEIVEAAKHHLQRGAKPEDVADALEAAKERKRIEAEKRAKLIAKSRYTSRNVDPFDMLGIVPQRVSGWDKGHPPTEKQIALLAKFKVPTPDWLNRKQATQLIGECLRYPSPKQQKVLQRAGFNPKMQRELAKPIINLLAANGWQWPNGVPRPNYDGQVPPSES